MIKLKEELKITKFSNEFLRWFGNRGTYSDESDSIIESTDEDLE